MTTDWKKVERFLRQDYEIATIDGEYAEVSFRFWVEGHHPNRGQVGYCTEGVVNVGRGGDETVETRKYNIHCSDFDREAVKCAALLLAYNYGYIAKETFHE